VRAIALGEPAGGGLADAHEARRRRPHRSARNHDRHAGHPQPDREGKIAQMYSAIQTGQGQACRRSTSACRIWWQKGRREPRRSQIQGTKQGQHLNGARSAIRLMAGSAAADGREEKGRTFSSRPEFPPAIKVDGEIRPQSDRTLTPEQSSSLVRAIMNDRQTKEFDATKECNFANSPAGNRALCRERVRPAGIIPGGAADPSTPRSPLEELELPPV